MNEVFIPIAVAAVFVLIIRYIIISERIDDMVNRIITDAQYLSVSKLGALGTKNKFSEDTIVLCLQLARAYCLSTKHLESRNKEPIIETLLKDYVVKVKGVKDVNGYVGKPVDRKIRFQGIIRLSSTFDRIVACIGAAASLVALIL